LSKEWKKRKTMAGETIWHYMKQNNVKLYIDIKTYVRYTCPCRAVGTVALTPKGGDCMEAICTLLALAIILLIILKPMQK
jgi:hypothetical protein